MICAELSSAGLANRLDLDLVSFGLRIDNRCRQLCEYFVRCLFLIKRFREQFYRVLVSEFPGPSNQSAVAGYLVVFDGLRRCEQPSVQSG